ncbi:MAG: hypothetical protein C4527_12380 [Candidatus Omnitrophota bacterium]|nr:MAG: hypothetical protein C4527_12380 [Candidatus Omnitrophota bacterium]
MAYSIPAEADLAENRPIFSLHKSKIPGYVYKIINSTPTPTPTLPFFPTPTPTVTPTPTIPFEEYPVVETPPVEAGKVDRATPNTNPNAGDDYQTEESSSIPTPVSAVPPPGLYSPLSGESSVTVIRNQIIISLHENSVLNEPSDFGTYNSSDKENQFTTSPENPFTDAPPIPQVVIGEIEWHDEFTKFFQDFENDVPDAGQTAIPNLAIQQSMFVQYPTSEHIAQNRVRSSIPIPESDRIPTPTPTPTPLQNRSQQIACTDTSSAGISQKEIRKIPSVQNDLSQFAGTHETTEKNRWEFLTRNFIFFLFLVMGFMGFPCAKYITKFKRYHYR